MTSSVEILPLGGLRDIGKNCMLVKYGDQAVMIDCGMGFPGSDDLMEDDYFIPDFGIIDELGIELLGCVITHGHEDHIGAVPYLLQQFDVPVYMTRFPMMVLNERINTYAKFKNNIKAFDYRNVPTITLGDFRIDMIDVPHSIPEAKALIIRVGGFTIVHTGDFKYENGESSPFSGKVPENVDVLLSDSTNIERTGYSEGEELILDNIAEIIENAQGRVIATAFSSNTERISNIINISQQKGRTIGLLGRSVNSYMQIASALGHLRLPPSIITDKSAINRIPENRITLIVTGSQAEPRSVMRRLSQDMMKSVSVRSGDTIFFSSKNIPGNELSIGRMIDNLVAKGAKVYYENTDKIHVSGHAFRNDIVQAFKDVNPRFVVPVHGHRRFLELSAELAEQNGYSSVVITDGEMLSIRKDRMPAIVHTYDVTTKIVSHGEVGFIDFDNIHDRKRVARAGFMTVMLVVDMFGDALLSAPKILSVGIAGASKINKIEREVRDIIDDYFKHDLPDEPAWEEVEEDLRILIRRYLKDITDTKPLVNVVITTLE
ncbi:ribonuclease J [bacterium]|nr:ribonuclease J [bacterium]